MDDRSPAPDRGPWIIRWVRDQTFWRDVASQTISGVLVLLVVAAAAAVASPVVRPLAVAFAVVASLLIVFVGVGYAIMNRIVGKARPSSGRRIIAAYVFGIAWLVLFVVVTQLLDASSLLPRFDIDIPWLRPLKDFLQSLLG